MSFADKLCEELNKYSEVIIYGYADIGKCVLKFIIDFDTDIKYANYAGKVKYFTTSNDKRSSKRTEIRGIKIKSISELVEYKDNALIIVATQEKHHQDITTKLDELGFKNRLYIMHNNYCELKEKTENHSNILNNRIGQYHINHSIKLERLRHKVELGNKIKVFFMSHDAAVFGASSVYHAMKESDLFEPYIFVISRRDVSYDKFMEDVQKDVHFFEKHGYRVICGYDSFGTPIDLHEYNPDIVFFDLPKLHGNSNSFYYRLDNINWEYLTCYIPYGLNMVDSFYYHYHLDAIREAWRYFVDSKSDYKRCLADADFNGYNTVFAGYPKFDEYNDNVGDIPKKIDNGKPIVIYAAHHSLGVSNNFATFDLYGLDILNFAKQNKDLNFVFKPHPLLKFQIRSRYKSGAIDISEDDYIRYLEEWERLPNGVVVEGGAYIELFKKSNCMITDCGSFIGEYLPSKHPCIYLLNPRKKNQLDVYTTVGRNILDTYYIVGDKQNLEEIVDQVILRGEDPKYEARLKCLNKEFDMIGFSGEKICKYLEKELRL